MASNNLEARLIQFAVSIILLTDSFSKAYAGRTLTEQVTRSSTSAALNYGECQSAESPKDFLHKLKVVLKELRETHVNLRIVRGANLCTQAIRLEELISENNELIAIFVKSVDTARRNMGSLKKKV